MNNKIIEIGSLAVGCIAALYTTAPYAVFVASVDEFRKNHTGFTIRVYGKRADGLQFATTDRGFVFLLESSDFKKLIEDHGGEGLAFFNYAAHRNLPHPDWLYSLYSNPTFYTPNPSMMSILYHETVQGKADKVTRRLEAERKLDEQLVTMEVPVTEETRKLLWQVQNFNYHYAYIDDGDQWRAANERYKSLKKEVSPWPKFTELFNAGGVIKK